MIDIHTHILPGIDDGASDLSETIDMINQSINQGVTDVIFTPHFFYGAPDGGGSRKSVLKLFDRVKKCVQLEKLHIRLHLGMEVFLSPGLEEVLNNSDLLTLNQSRYLLVEFPFTADDTYFSRYLKILDCYGIKPIIAHPERYEAIIDTPFLAYLWNQKGYVLQINSGSLLGEFGEAVQETAKLLLDHNLAQIIASDSHNISSRRPNLLDTYEFVINSYSKGYGDLLFKVNPKFVLDDQEVLIINPKEPKSRLFY